MMFVFIVDVDVPDEEVNDFLNDYKRKHFDFFRYLADNQAEIKLVRVDGFKVEYISDLMGLVGDE